MGSIVDADFEEDDDEDDDEDDEETSIRVARSSLAASNRHDDDGNLLKFAEMGQSAKAVKCRRQAPFLTRIRASRNGLRLRDRTGRGSSVDATTVDSR